MDLAICSITQNKRRVTRLLAISLWLGLVKYEENGQRQDITQGLSYHLSLL